MAVQMLYTVSDKIEIDVMVYYPKYMIFGDVFFQSKVIYEFVFRRFVGYHPDKVPPDIIRFDSYHKEPLVIIN